MTQLVEVLENISPESNRDDGPVEASRKVAEKADSLISDLPQLKARPIGISGVLSSGQCPEVDCRAPQGRNR